MNWYICLKSYGYCCYYYSVIEILLRRERIRRGSCPQRYSKAFWWKTCTEIYLRTDENNFVKDRLYTSDVGV